VEELFELVRVGDEVELIENPTPEIAGLFDGQAPPSLQAKTLASAATVGGLQ
jgi:hypothetical protein